MSRDHTESRRFLLFELPCWHGDWRCMGGWEKNRWPKLYKGILQTASHYALHKKCGEEEGKFQSHHSEWFGSALLGMAENLPIHGKEWIIFCFVLLACVTFAFPIKLSLFQSTCFLPFTLPILSPMPPGGQGASSCGARLLTGVKARYKCITFVFQNQTVFSYV